MKHLLLLAIVFACACGQKSQRADEKLNEPPPPNETPAALPEGPPVVRQAGDAVPEPPAAEAEEAPSVTRAELDGFLDRGPSYVLTIVTVEPMHGAQGFVGYQITEVTSGARAFMTPQLRVGDVVTHINGVRIMRPEDFMQAWRSLDKVTTIRVDFARQNEPMHAVWVVK